MMWKSSSTRFQERAARSGFKNAPPIWEEEVSHAQPGWLSGPIPIDNSGSAPWFFLRRREFPFRLGVGQNEKLRACDDLKHNMANLRTSVSAPNYSANLGPHFSDG